jgi:hypothetical protein
MNPDELAGHEAFLSYAIEQAENSRKEGGIPIGAGDVISQSDFSFNFHSYCC